jgi:hypothetical protein
MICRVILTVVFVIVVVMSSVRCDDQSNGDVTSRAVSEQQLLKLLNQNRELAP